jgi:hypothetical protein
MFLSGSWFARGFGPWSAEVSLSRVTASLYCWRQCAHPGEVEHTSREQKNRPGEKRTIFSTFLWKNSDTTKKFVRDEKIQLAERSAMPFFPGRAPPQPGLPGVDIAPLIPFNGAHDYIPKKISQE